MTAFWLKSSVLAVALLGISACGGGGGADDDGDDVAQYTVTLNVGAHGAATPLTATVNEGNTSNFTVTAETGYHIDTVSGCGATANGGAGVYSTSAITANCSVTISFAINQYDVAIAINAGGSVTPNATTAVNHGATTSFTFTANDGFELSNVSGCGGSLAGNVYTTGAITANCSVDGQFAALTTLHGTAAAGAPIIGAVWVKDVHATVRNAAIALDGSYTLDVAGMTPPLLVNARGSVGGRIVNYSSVAQAADLGGTINITPFTDLILANVIGQITQNYFDNADFADLNHDDIEAARAQVTARLQPVLTALGLEAGIDLLRESFNTDHTGLDAALDILRVDANPQTNIVTITNVLTQQSISDDVTTSSDTTALPTPGDVNTQLSDFDAIMARFNAFYALFATSVPANDSPAYMAFFDTTSFLDDGSTDPNQLLQGAATGFSFGNYSIVEKRSDSHWIVGAVVFDDHNEPDGGSLEWHVKKIDGVWKFAGNQLQVWANFIPQVWRSFYDNAYHYDSHIELHFDSYNTNVRYVLLRGPGLNYVYPNFGNVTGVLFDLAERKTINANNTYDGDWLRDCADVAPGVVCYNRDQLQTGRQYSARAINASYQAIGAAGKISLKAIPSTAQYAQANQATLYPHISGVSKAGNAVTTIAQATSGGELTVNWTLPTTTHHTCISIVGYQVNGTAGYEDSRNESIACDDTSGVVSTTTYAGTPNWAAVWIWLYHDTGIEYGENHQWLP